ncbi:hypothetical protein HanPI659440_Chr14g0555691 [Helianthus annuus]|nr:hypothetical protein HanPI659440_Chr14g0555691 [Helianthus annuus]
MKDSKVFYLLPSDFLAPHGHISIHYPKNRATLQINNKNESSTAKVIHSVDGKLQEFWQPITASHILSDHPDTFFLCSSENMFVNWHVPHVSGDEELELVMKMRWLEAVVVGDEGWKVEAVEGGGGSRRRRRRRVEAVVVGGVCRRCRVEAMVCSQWSDD